LHFITQEKLVADKRF